MEFLIYSREHDGWWGPNRCGYVRHEAAAGRYGMEVAKQICEDANRYVDHKHDGPNEFFYPAPEDVL
jgi:hypothetical protein